ncbi:MAG TPA: universal stress protein [Chthonomonas sp.]|uniref:universal stress protein n=1 Tax=Chthonomonas sp. TaxID=2282153 RepID=UPI002B4B52C0|nr:universal stress protein [Chthonomonas sp.]HLI47951.1 universal stress protein [Chthonomonas sp.]
MFQTILVGYDGSENALHAAESAARLAKLFGSHVILLNVFPYPYTLIPDGLFDQGEVALDPETVARLAREDLRVVEDVALPVFEKYGVACQIVQEIGAPIEKILHTARKHHVDLIVVGSRGLSGWQQLLLGSVASGVLQQHDFPVLVVRKQRVEFRSLLLATDGSASSAKAAATAFELADRLDVPLSVLCVRDTRKHWLARKTEATIDTGQLQKALEEELERLRGNKDVLIHLRLRDGNPAQEIVEFASENDKDLIIMGSRGLDPVRSLFLGSTSRAVVHHAPCSVLVVPRGE